MKIYNALDLKAGKKAEYNRMGTITQPVQFLPFEEKDCDWAASNMDWLEWEGIKQIRRNAKRLMKNYKLAKGIIDKSDYLISDDNEYADLIDQLTSENDSALELKYYSVIPNVIRTLVSEFSKRNKRVSFRAVDEYSYNEILEQRRAEIENVLVQEAEEKFLMALLEQGLDPNTPEIQEKIQEHMSPKNLRSLPEIEDWFSKNYQTLGEQWASKQHLIDEERFKMDELEERAFEDMLITDREFWHFKMLEDDYDIELWNPVITFYHKSPDTRYISQGNWVGKIEMMSTADVIDKYGWVMSEEQHRAIEAIYPIKSAGYPIAGYQNDGIFYDATKSHEWNTEMPSLAYRQFMSMHDGYGMGGGDIVEWIMGESEDYFDSGSAHLLRVTTTYWKTQRKVGHLTKIDEVGNVTTEIVDEIYKCTDKPIYNTSLFKNKTKDNLLFGEHIDWIWINQVWGGVKIGPNRPTFWGQTNPGGINTIYIGINQNKIGPLKFQFKGDSTLYGCKLPVEGRVFSDRNSKSTSLVDLMKPFQIAYNLVNNQIADILIDELGTVIMLDQNSLPQKSLGEDWGKGNYAKAYVAMKDFQILPLDTAISNTENALNFNHFQVLDLAQTQRLMSRVNLANYFKQQAFEVIGITPQRLGQEISQYDTAKGIEQAVSGSYAQTEVYFIQHSDHLMPRVHQMRTDLAQFYHSTKPSVRLLHTNTIGERINFELNGTELMLRDINVFCTAKANHRAILEQIKMLAMNNNTAGASIYDLAHIMETDSVGNLNSILKTIEEKQQNQRESEMQQQQQMQQAELEAREKEKAMQLEHEALENEKNRRKDILVAEIRAAGYGAMQDVNQNQQSDFEDSMARIEQKEQYQETLNIQRERNVSQDRQFNQKMDLERTKLAQQKQLKDIDLQIAKENKNKYDVKKKDTAKSKTKK
jgi:hypothetical protein